MKYIIGFFLTISIFHSTIGQGISEELGFLFVKGKYLMDTERFDDAIAEFNKIINEAPEFENALLLRAEAKYVLGAYKGVKRDVLQFIELNGVTTDAAKLLGLSDYELKNYKAAKNSLELVADQLTDEMDVFLALADIHNTDGDKQAACINWKKAANLGSSAAKRKVNSTCGGMVLRDKKPKKRPTKVERPTPSDLDLDSENQTESETEDNMKQGGELDDEYTDSETNEPEVRNEPVKEAKEVIDLDAVNKIYVDEDLTLKLKDGLGDLEVLEQPNILILSDESGIVTVDLCVSRGGRVESARFNQEKSSLATKSIISLAVRKAKEFWFEKSIRRGDVCGMLEFVVTGRE